MSDACVNYVGFLDRDGYGRKYYRGRSWSAHRLAWTLAFGSIPEGLCVLHKCDNPQCVNVEHLFLGTHADNAADRSTKGRDGNGKKTHCPAGHPYSGDNLYVAPGSAERKCRACNLKAHFRYRERVGSVTDE